MSAVSERFIVGRTEDSVTRRCPFCGGLVEDGLHRDVNFAIHLGTPTPSHLAKQDWADYIAFINRV